MIMKFLNEAVAELYSGIMVYSEETNSSFFCDFDMAEPLDPEKISRTWNSASRDISWSRTPVLDIKTYTPSLDRIEAPGVPEWCSHWPKSAEASEHFDWASEFNF